MEINSAEVDRREVVPLWMPGPGEALQSCPKGTKVLGLTPHRLHLGRTGTWQEEATQQLSGSVVQSKVQRQEDTDPDAADGGCFHLLGHYRQTDETEPCCLAVLEAVRESRSRP